MRAITPFQIICKHDKPASKNKPQPAPQPIPHRGSNLDQDHKSKYQANRKDMKKMLRLAQLHCDPSRALAEQPHCESIIEEMKETAKKGRQIDIDYLTEKLKK